MATAIEALVAHDDDERAFMRGFSEPALANWNGIEVGTLRATARLRQALGALA
jgi:hypothetical protein